MASIWQEMPEGPAVVSIVPQGPNVQFTQLRSRRFFGLTKMHFVKRAIFGAGASPSPCWRRNFLTPGREVGLGSARLGASNLERTVAA